MTTTIPTRVYCGYTNKKVGPVLHGWTDVLEDGTCASCGAELHLDAESYADKDADRFHVFNEEPATTDPLLAALADGGLEVAKAQDVLSRARFELNKAIRAAHAGGKTEVEIATFARVNRTTVRRALGK